MKTMLLVRLREDNVARPIARFCRRDDSWSLFVRDAPIHSKLRSRLSSASQKSASYPLQEA